MPGDYTKQNNQPFHLILQIALKKGENAKKKKKILTCSSWHWLSFWLTHSACPLFHRERKGKVREDHNFTS